MECSTRESSSVVAWAQEWIQSQRVGGYLVGNHHINCVSHSLIFLSVCVLILIFSFYATLFTHLSVACQLMFSMISVLLWTSFHHCVHIFFLKWRAWEISQRCRFNLHAALQMTRIFQYNLLLDIGIFSLLRAYSKIKGVSSAPDGVRRTVD